MGSMRRDDLLALPPESVPAVEPVPTHRVRAVWISDLHLGTPGCRAAALLDFLRRVECDTLYLVARGEVGVLIHAEGAPDKEVARLGRGALFGEMSVLTGDPRTATVVSLGDSAMVVRVWAHLGPSPGLPRVRSGPSRSHPSPRLTERNR